MNLYKKIISSFACCLLASIMYAQTTTVSGSIIDAETNITVQIKGENFDQTVAVDAQGNYQIDNVPTGVEMTITPIKADDYLNGVSALDLVFGQKHILQDTPFDETRKYIAGDLNVSGTVSIMDLILHRRLVLGQLVELPDVSSWRFIEEQQFAEIEINECNYSQNFTNTFLISDTQPNVFNFMAIKIADISGNATK